MVELYGEVALLLMLSFVVGAVLAWAWIALRVPKAPDPNAQPERWKQ